MDVSCDYTVRGLAVAGFGVNSSRVKSRIQVESLVRKSGLYPYLKKYFSESTALDKEFLLSLYQSEVDPDFVFHSMQAKVFNLLLDGRNVVLSAPTSMGKSAIVDSLIASKKYNIIVIVVPTIALIDETRRRIIRNFGNNFQVIHHGSQERHKRRAIYVLTQERVNERDDIDNVDLFVVDEFYKLAFSQDDKSRVISLNIALSKLLTVSKQFYMIGPFIDAVRGLDSVYQDYVFVPSGFNTVAQNVNEYNISPTNLVEKNARLSEILKSYDGQTIIYCKSQASIEQVVSYLDCLPTENLSVELKKYYEWLKRNYGESWCYTRAIKLGIGVHHGVLPRSLQQKTIQLFNDGYVSKLICTSTLIEGVNTIAENVVIYDNKRSTVSIDSFTHKNISGRAGRMNTHLVGNVFCLEALPKSNAESNVVDLPIGQQDEKTPMNLLANLQDEHLAASSSEYIDTFSSSSQFPIEMVRRHASYEVESIRLAYDFVQSLSEKEVRVICGSDGINAGQLNLLSKFT